MANKTQSSISFKNYSKQFPVPFKIYADFECNLRPTLSKGVKSSDKNNASYTEKYQDHIPCSFAYKVVCVDKMLLTNLSKQFLKSINAVEK